MCHTNNSKLISINNFSQLQVLFSVPSAVLLSYLNSFNPYNNPVLQIRSLSRERLSHLTKVTQLGSGGARSWTQRVGVWSLCSWTLPDSGNSCLWSLRSSCRASSNENNWTFVKHMIQEPRANAQNSTWHREALYKYLLNVWKIDDSPSVWESLLQIGDAHSALEALALATFSTVTLCPPPTFPF